MLSNSIFGGALAAAYLTLLMLHLNPRVPLTASGVVPLAATLMLSYGLHASAIFYVVSVVRQLVTGPVSPGWISLRVVTWRSALLAGLAASVSWLNASGFRAALEPSVYDALVRTAFAFATAAAVFLLLALTHARSGRARALVAWVFALTVVASMALPLAWRGPGLYQNAQSHRLVFGDAVTASASAPRVTLLLLEGASLDVIAPAVAEGRLPNFGRLLDEGASMHLATIRPSQPEPVWASAMTGKWPPKHGIRSSAVYYPMAGGVALRLLPDYCFAQALVRFGFFRVEPQAPDALRARTLWQILTSRGIDSGIIGLPLTQPPEPIRGFIVSDRFSRSGEPAVELDERPAVYPQDMLERARESLSSVAAVPDAVVHADMLPPGERGSAALVADRVYHDLAERLPGVRDVRLLAVRYPGLAAVGRYYLRYATPQAFGDVSASERQRFGQVLEDYYAYIDRLVGDAMALRDDDLLLVVSGFGMEPLTPGQRLAERLFGDPRSSGTHERAPEGFLFAYGSMVAPGRAGRGALVDVTPTVLYFLGLPVARDMDGFARTDIFNRPFNTQRTITFIPTYDR